MAIFVKMNSYGTSMTSNIIYDIGHILRDHRRDAEQLSFSMPFSSVFFLFLSFFCTGVSVICGSFRAFHTVLVLFSEPFAEFFFKVKEYIHFCKFRDLDNLISIRHPSWNKRAKGSLGERDTVMASMRSVLHGKSSSEASAMSRTNRVRAEENAGVMRKLPRQAEKEAQWSVGGICTGSRPHFPTHLTSFRSFPTHLTSFRSAFARSASPCPHARYIFPVAAIFAVADAGYPLTFPPNNHGPRRSDSRPPGFFRPPFGRSHVSANRKLPATFLLLGRIPGEVRAILRRLWTSQPRGKDTT